jgi:hypothetical protein|tara:strand:- start:1015 stop:1308 length:294 start_codon:yes stop_codon:yes gene_type:complete
MTVIKFPNTPANQMSDTAKLAIEMEKEKQTVEIFLNWRLNQDDWDLYHIAERDLELVAMFGEVMNLIPLVSLRLNTKLAEFICKLNIQQNLPKAKDD